VIVIDASALTKYILHEEGWEEVRSFIKDKGPLYSIDHLIKEVSNAIWKHHFLRRLVTLEDALKLYHGLNKLISTGVIIIEHEGKHLESAMKIALRHGIMVHDSLYIAQAQKLRDILQVMKVK